MTDHSPELHGELSGLLQQLTTPGRRFGHREHVQLAFELTRKHGTSAAAAQLSTLLQRLAVHAQAPQKYHATLTRAWAALVGWHFDADPSVTGFDEFARRYPELLEKRLLERHYSPARLASAAARSGWIEPDLAPFPWTRGPSPEVAG
jgi:hypothetical protein